ncbi:MAG TPA: DUF3189 family protein [Firmicutes bacterium]|nr:DUF3189 family protein [Bacillota bacterium]
MRIIYHCYGSAHSSVVAAAIHVGILPSDRVPSAREILDVPHFDRTGSDEIGTCFFMGEDEGGNHVYIMGMGHAKDIVRRAIYSILEIYGIPRSDLLLVNALPQVGLITRVGGVLSRRIGLVRAGRPLTIYGIQRSYRNFVRMVASIKREIGVAK